MAGDPRKNTKPKPQGAPNPQKSLRERILEIVATGDAQYHRELLAEFPPTILDLLHLQGVGPKTVATLYTQLGIETLDDLERAAAGGRIRAANDPRGGAIFTIVVPAPSREAGTGDDT